MAGKFIKFIKLMAASALVFPSMSVAVPVVVNQYDFDDYSDTLGAGMDMVDEGGSLGGGRYSFGFNQGLILDNALLDTSEYQVEIKFRIDDTAGNPWKKIIDFADLTSDLGLYVLNDGLQFFNNTGEGATSIPFGEDIIVLLTRDSTGLVSGFVNGGLQWSFNDGTNNAVPPGNRLRFFHDDDQTGQREAFAGSVDWIKIYAEVEVPEPGTIALLGIGLLGLGLSRRRTTF